MRCEAHGNTETVQAWVQHGQDGRRQQGPAGGTEHPHFQPSVRTVTIALGIIAGLTASVWSRRHQTVVHLNEYTCECDSGFELKLTARVAVYQLPLTMLTMCSRTSLSLRKLSSTGVVGQCLQSQSRDGREQKRNLQNDIRGQTARAFQNKCNQTSENTFYCQHQLSRRHCIQQSAGRSGAQVANATRRGGTRRSS